MGVVCNNVNFDVDADGVVTKWVIAPSITTGTTMCMEDADNAELRISGGMLHLLGNSESCTDENGMTCTYSITGGLLPFWMSLLPLPMPMT